jgi:hypothetical protein
VTLENTSVDAMVPRQTRDWVHGRKTTGSFWRTRLRRLCSSSMTMRVSHALDSFSGDDAVDDDDVRQGSGTRSDEDGIGIDGADASGAVVVLDTGIHLNVDENANSNLRIGASLLSLPDEDGQGLLAQWLVIVLDDHDPDHGRGPLVEDEDEKVRQISG